MNKRILTATYVVSDWLTAAVSWTILFAYRKVFIEEASETTMWNLMSDFRYQLGLLVIPLFWIFIHIIAGLYFRPLKRHRILEIGQVTWTSLLGGGSSFLRSAARRCDIELPAVLCFFERSHLEPMVLDHGRKAVDYHPNCEEDSFRSMEFSHLGYRRQ